MFILLKKVYNGFVMAMDYIRKGESRVLHDGSLVECTEAGITIVHNPDNSNIPKTKMEYKEILPTQLTSKEIMFVEDYMRPNKMSKSGFLAPDENLMDVYIKDKKTLDKYNISFDEMHEVLKYFLNETSIEFKGIDQAHKNIPRFPVGVSRYGKKYLASITYYMGFQECPFEEIRDYHDCKQGKGTCDITIYNVLNGTEVKFSELHLHLVKYHNFFEGSTEYRLDPIDAIRCFEMADVEEVDIKKKPSVEIETENLTKAPEYIELTEEAEEVEEAEPIEEDTGPKPIKKVFPDDLEI
jgi:hypothetical protein